MRFAEMANWPQFAGWPGPPPQQQQQQPGPPSFSYGKNAAEFRPGTPFLQHSPRMSPPSFHQFPPRGSGPPPDSPSHAVYGNVYPPSGASPGFNNNSQRWSPYPRCYPATVPIPRTSLPNVSHAQSQNFSPVLGYGAPGNHVSVAPPSQSHGPDQHVPMHDSRRASVVGYNVSAVVPWSNDVRPNVAVKPLFLNWIDESVKDSSSSQLVGDSGDRVSGLRTSFDNSVVLKSSDLYKLVDMVEDTIGKILVLTDLQTSRTEWGVCPFNPHHVVPVEALLRHTLQCPSSLEGTVEASSLLHSLQYPHTVDLDPTERFVHHERISDRHPAVESSSNHATLSFEDVALFSVNYTPIRQLDLEAVKQESGPVGTENLSETPRVEMKVEITDNGSEKPECRTLTLSTSRQQFDPRGSLFFYREAPGVVLTSLALCSSKGFGDPMSSMPPSLRVEMEKCSFVTLKSVRNEEINNRRSVSSTRAIGYAGVKHRHSDEEEEVKKEDEESHGFAKESSSVRLLPSMLLILGKELDSWKGMPSLCSRTVLEAATCLGRVRKALIVEWLLVHSPVYGVVLDVATAAHISCLVQLYLKALRTQSLMLLDHSSARGFNKRDISITSDTMVVECPMYAEASTWLASWLSHLYGPINSKVVVLDILKHCLKSCGRLLSIVPLDLNSQQAGFKTRGKSEDVKVASDKEFKVFMEHSKMLSKGADNAGICVSNLMALEEILEVKQVGAAMDALYERANFERYIKSGLSINNPTKTQRIANYDMTVNFANNERAKRPNYRAVCEYDGLTWQQSQQEEKRNKTKAELLAEERDYKRRRMSYRGKKLKRTPLQVLHDIIENHMTEITEAGGIGCFSKQALHIPSISHTDFESQQQLQESIPTNPNFQHHSGSAHHSRTTSTETAGNASRLYDGHRETSSAVRNESRSRSRSRYDDERHHNSRR